MPTWARLDGGTTVIEVFTHPTIAPAQVYVPSIAAQFVISPDGTRPGATKVGNTWTNPVPPPPPPPPAPVRAMLDPATFLGLLQQAGGVTDAQMNAFAADVSMGWAKLYMQSLKHGVVYPDETPEGLLTTKVLDALQATPTVNPYLTANGRAAMLGFWPTI